MRQINDLSHLTDEQIQQELLIGSRVLMYQKARDHMQDYCHLMMPDTLDPNDTSKTEYDRTGHAKMLCDIVERFESGKSKRVAVSIPPQHGKTIHLTQIGLSWIWGKNPRKNIVVVTYNQTRADELGHEFRQMIKDKPAFRQVFPEVEFMVDAKSKSFMQNKKGGKIFFIGVGGTITGRTADYIIIDDPFKGDDDEFTTNHLEKIWSWFYKVAYSRASNKTKICVIHTRWNEDDLIGRLCDPTHPERNKRFKGISQDWEFMNIPGVIRDERLANALGLKLTVPKDPRVIEQFGDKPCTALWPKEKSLEFFAQWKRGDPQSFSALVMGSPAPEDGLYFTSDMIVEYHSPSDLPTNLRKYGASDHAVSEKQKRDKTVLGCVGIDEHDNIWVLPDLVWDQMETDRTVEELLSMFRRHKPHCHWMESELISKSFGPFLRKRMVEEQVYTLIDPVTPSQDKRTRARSIQGRMSMKKVFFPAFAPWFSDAKNQMLKFGSGGANDDFVDWIAWIGLGLTKEIAAQSYRPPKSNIPKTGTAAWVIHSSEQLKSQQKNISKGW
jgi:predicted phage terminase large subunit-like protein